MKRRTQFLATGFLLLALAAFAQEAQKSPGLSYLLDGAVRIFVVDETRCSANPNSKEGGRWYLIEGEETLDGLRAQLSKLDTASGGGCMCGGPDIHFYAQTAASETTYFGLDCEEYLAGVEIPKSLQGELIPARPTFLGKRMGQTYIVDLPYETEEGEARSKFDGAGFRLLTGGWWNMSTRALPRRYYTENRLKETAPAYLLVELGPFKPPKPQPRWPKNPTPEEEEEAQKRFDAWYAETKAATSGEATRLLDAWLGRWGLTGHLLRPYRLRMGDSDLKEDRFTVELYLDDEKAAKAAVSDPEAKGTKLVVADVEYRASRPFKGPSHYQAALLLPENPTPEEIAKAKAVLPGIGRVIPLCECKEMPRS